MSLFIHKENQTLLWQLIQQSPLWNDFNNMYKGHSELWFKNIISLFYDKYWNIYSSSTMNVEDLKRINREVISYMVSDIKKSLLPPPVIPQKPQLQSQTVIRESDIDYSQDIHNRLSQYDKPPEPINQTLTQYNQLQESYNVQKEKEEKMEKAKKDFEEFQKKYNTGFERKPPPPIDFSMKLDTERIRNMDELIQLQMAEREKDLEGIPLANIQ